LIESVRETGSTNADLLERARKGAPEGLWLRADQQTNGRGRMGRVWDAEPGNLFTSTIVRITAGDPPPSTLSFVAGLALRDVLAPFVPANRLKLKWPNDIMLADAKLSGILLERCDDAVVVGFGVNLVEAPDIAGRQVTCLREHAIAHVADAATLNLDLARAFADGLAAWRASGVEPVLRRWLQVAHSAGKAMRISLPNGELLVGTFAGIDSEGALILKRDNGSMHVVHAGDVELLKEHFPDEAKGS
jgi:BirA family transcriptional regulator, biotin operon repressor / biotin---[acetyl-CoA-carboxylase] ligase